MWIENSTNGIAPTIAGVAYSMHTMTICVKLTKQKWHSIKESLIDFSEEKEIPYFNKKHIFGSKVVHFMMSKQTGFNEVVICKYRLYEKPLYTMEIKINPRKLFHGDNHPFVYIASEEEIIKSFQQIQKFLDTVGIIEITYQDFYVKRIDYCANIDLGSEDDVAEYMCLMKKGAYPYKSERLMEYSHSGKRYIPTKNSFTVSSKNFELAIYNKYLQLKEEGDKYQPEEIEEARGIIRIELRVKRQKIKWEEIKYGCSGAYDFLQRTSEIAAKNLPRYLYMSYGQGRFVRLAEARAIIEASVYKDKTKNSLMNILHIVSRSTLQEAKVICGKHFCKYMKKFNELGISPITISKRAVRGRFENPVYYIEYRNKNQ